MFNNQLKTILFISILTGLLLGIGQLIGGKAGLTIALIFAIGFNGLMYFFSHKIVLFMYKAKEADKIKYKELYKTVKEIADLAAIPMPKVYIIPTEQANAFASGRNPKNAIVACTEGIMKLLTNEELKGVLAHEISHVKNRDILITTIAATVAGVISYLGAMARWSAIFGFGSDNDRGSNIIELLVIGILTPLLALVIQLAISRSREYLADESGAKLLGNGEPLARALEKIEASVKHNPMQFGNPTTSSLFIANPFRSENLFALLSTHPATSKRTAKLRSMKL
ncbi:zinc metalloprotease HtpX [Candidatus Woesearchaeota archaeon]|nr:zinc metalloprotease HtpX [Candidatus Woesearchaeota archaeon]